MEFISFPSPEMELFSSQRIWCVGSPSNGPRRSPPALHNMQLTTRIVSDTDFRRPMYTNDNMFFVFLMVVSDLENLRIFYELIFSSSFN